MNPSVLSICALCLVLPAASIAGICDENQALMDFSEQDRVQSEYFAAYYITRKKKVYYIYANRRVFVPLQRLVEVMDAFTDYPEFMPGYRDIKIATGDEDELLTAIKFRADFSPFTSHFTTQVESHRDATEYKQCWQQLKPDDTRVIEEYRSAPRVNQGFWWLTEAGDGMVEMNYFSVIRPPVSIPGWLYESIVKGTYAEVFDAIIHRAHNTPSD